MTLTVLRQQLEAQVREGQLPEALQALLAELPEGGETYRIVSAFIARLNAANKERFRNTISSEDYQRRVDQVSADFFDLLAGLQESDFQAKPSPAKSSAGKQGSVLYRVPNLMRLQKPTRCTIRIAVDEDAILDNIVLDEHVEIKSKVEISDVMSAELLDPEGGTFQINPLNARTQLVRETGYTEWNFNVTPMKEGVHQLLLKVSILEKVAGFDEPIPREVSLLETVTILTEAAPPGDEPSQAFRSSGQTFAFESSATTQGAYEVSYSQGMGQPAPLPAQTRAGNRNLRALALFLAFLVLVPAATFAIAPDLPAYVSAIIQDTPEAYTHFIEEHPDSPRLEKAYFYRAEKSGQLAYLRAYEDRFEQTGKYREKVRARISALEARQLASVMEQPDSLKIHQFVADFPESERLSEVKKAVETRQENRQELLAEVESAYVRSMKAKPTEAKVSAYLRDFPKHDKLEEIVDAAAKKPELIEKIRPKLEDIAVQDLQNEAVDPKKPKNRGDLRGDNPFGKDNGTGGGTGGGAGAGSGVLVLGGLQGRAIVSKPRMDTENAHSGIVVIDICVDSTGAVTSAEYTQRGSTTKDAVLRERSILAAKKYRFKPNQSPKECGSLRFRYFSR